MNRKFRKRQASHITRYLRELSVVIIGVFITLLITNIISNRSRHNEVKRMMALIKTELAENSANLERARQKWETEQKVYAFLRQRMNQVENIPVDTLEKYRNVIGDKHSFPVNKDSYEVFKSSSLTQYIKDKDFLRDLSRAYGSLDLMQAKLDNYANMKANGINHIINNLDKSTLEKWLNGNTSDFFIIPLNDNVFRAFIYTGGTLITDNEFNDYQKEVAAVIGRISRKEY